MGDLCEATVCACVRKMYDVCRKDFCGVIEHRSVPSTFAVPMDFPSPGHAPPDSQLKPGHDKLRHFAVFLVVLKGF